MQPSRNFFPYCLLPVMTTSPISSCVTKAISAGHNLGYIAAIVTIILQDVQNNCSDQIYVFIYLKIIIDVS